MAKKKGRPRKRSERGGTKTASKSRGGDARVPLAEWAACYRETLPEGMKSSVWAELADHLGMVRAVTDSLPKRTYNFLALGQSEPIPPQSVTLFSQDYWIETLEYLHLASAAGLMRDLRWVDGVLASIACQRYHSFSANVRGLLESAADIYYVLRPIPSILAEKCPRISEALCGEAVDVMLVKVVDDYAQKQVERDIMEHLIHFAFAGRLRDRDEAPEYHVAERTVKYLSALQGADAGKVFDMYAELCEITHPGKESLAPFVTYAPDHLVLERHSELGLISDLSERHREAMKTAIVVGTNLCLMCLKILNRFPVSALHTPLLEQVDLSFIPEWRKLEPLLNTWEQQPQRPSPLHEIDLRRILLNDGE